MTWHIPQDTRVEAKLCGESESFHFKVSLTDRLNGLIGVGAGDATGSIKENIILYIDYRDSWICLLFALLAHAIKSFQVFIFVKAVHVLVK